MIRSALDLGAPVTEPGGKVGGEQLRPAGAGPQLAAHGGDQVDQPGVLLDRAQRRARSTVPVRADPAEVVADQVDDHHVLGVVLGRRSAGGARRCP